jgi:hypothetical protein
MSEEFRNEIANFIVYHENHLDFYKCVWQKLQALEVCSSNLKKSVVRLIEGSTVVNTELATIVGLIENLKALSGNILAYSFRDDLEEFNQIFRRVRLPFDDPGDNQLSIQVFLTLKDEQEILRHVLNVSALIRKALSLIEMIDISPQAVCADLAGKRQIERFLLVSSEVVDEASVEAKVGAELVQTVECRRTELAEKARQLGIKGSEAKQENEISHDESHLEVNRIFGIIEGWAQENFAKSLFQFKENTDNFKFLKVSEISKIWIDDNLRTVDALIEYDFGGVKKRNVSFQIDDDGKIIGFNLFEPIKG